MSRYLSFLLVVSLSYTCSVVQASSGTTTYNFSQKAIENVPDIVQKANSPNLNDRISILDDLIVKVPHSDTLAHRFVYYLPPEDYSSAVLSVLKGGLFTLKDAEKVQEIFIKIEEAVTKFNLVDLLPEVVPFLEYDDPGVKILTLGILDRLEAKQYSKEIVKAASNPDREIRLPALRMLIKFNAKEGVPVLIESLKEEKPLWLRRESIESLGRIGDPNAIPAIIPFLKSGLYQQAIIALVNLDAKEAVPYIKEAIPYFKEKGRDPHWDEVLLLTSLAYFGDEQAIKDIMSKMIETDDMEYISFLDRLVAINARSIIPTLIKALEEEKIVGGKSDRGPNLVRYLMITLGKLNATESVPVLRRYLNLPSIPTDIDDFLEGGAIEAIGILKAKEVVPDLLQILDSENKSIHYEVIRSETAMALARIGEPNSTGKLIAAMRKYKITNSEIFEELNHISDPNTYNKLANTEIPLIESLPGSKFLIQVAEKSGVHFNISEKIPYIDEFSLSNAVWSSYTGLRALNLAIYIFNHSGKSEAVYFIHEGSVNVVTPEEAYALWENWAAEYMRNHPNNYNL